MIFDEAIVNPEQNIELAKKLNPIIIEYRESANVCNSRHACYEESKKFYNWLKDNYENLFEELIEQGLEVAEGLFEIDNPEMLPLNEIDLENEELKEFLNLYQEQIDFLDTKNFSRLIWQYIINYAEEDRINDFFYMYHYWIEIVNEGMVIDFTWNQFENAIEDKSNIINRYETL